MPFGFVSRAQLDAYRDELRVDLRRSEEDQRAVIRKITLEWEEWFDKFRRLYARLAKRVSDEKSEGASQPTAAGDADRPTAGEPPRLPTLETAKASWRARRGLG
jgi:hypothetical protein